MLAALAAIVLMAAGLRLYGIGYLLPSTMNGDGMVLIRQVERFRGTSPAFDPQEGYHYSFYPHLMSRIAALLPEERTPLGRPVDLARHVELACAPWIRLRQISVLLSLLAIPASYLLARRFLDRGSSLFAAALVATSLHHIIVSIQEKPHGPATSFVALTLVAALRLRRKPDPLSFLLCGLAAGLAIGTLQNAAISLLPIGAAFLLRERGGCRASGWWIAATLVMLGVSLRIFHPFYFDPPAITDPAASRVETHGILDFARTVLASGGSRLGFGGGPWSKILRSMWGLDPLLITLAGLGILLWLIEAARHPERRSGALRGDLAVVLALVVPYAIVLGFYEQTLVRFCLPFWPILACAAAFAFQRVRDLWLRRSWSQPARFSASAAFCLALLAVPLWPALHLARIRGRPGPLDEAARWVEANVDPSEVVVVCPEHEMPILPPNQAITQDARLGRLPMRYLPIWTRYLLHAPPQSLPSLRKPDFVDPGECAYPVGEEWRVAALEFTLAPMPFLRKLGARYLILDTSRRETRSTIMSGRAVLETRFSPDVRGDARNPGVQIWGSGIDDWRPSVASILSVRSLGSTVEIYRIP